MMIDEEHASKICKYLCELVPLFRCFILKKHMQKRVPGVQQFLVDHRFKLGTCQPSISTERLGGI